MDDVTRRALLQGTGAAVAAVGLVQEAQARGFLHLRVKPGLSELVVGPEGGEADELHRAPVTPGDARVGIAAAGIEADVQKLVADMEASINEANAFISQMKT